MSPAMAELRSEQKATFQQYSPLELPTSANGTATYERDTYIEAHRNSPLDLIDWVRDLRSAPGIEEVLGGAGALLSADAVVPPDNLFRMFLRFGLFRDLAYLYDRKARVAHTLIALGTNVCGHPGLVHGGVSATICDETLGALAYMLKREGLLGTGPFFTAHLEVDYKKPLPSGSVVCSSARLISSEGRKVWASVELLNRPCGTVFAAGKALFVTPRQPPAQLQGNRASQAPAG